MHLQVSDDKSDDRKAEDEGSIDLVAPRWYPHSCKRTVTIGCSGNHVLNAAFFSPQNGCNYQNPCLSACFDAAWRNFCTFHAFRAAWHRKTQLYQNCAIRAAALPLCFSKKQNWPAVVDTFYCLVLFCTVVVNGFKSTRNQGKSQLKSEQVIEWSLLIWTDQFLCHTVGRLFYQRTSCQSSHRLGGIFRPDKLILGSCS